MKILHTADWHVGRLLRGRSRAAEHEAALASIAETARQGEVDLVIVAGDVFDSATPSPDAERIVYRALLDLTATGATVLVVAGNHDSERRLQAVAPLLELGRINTRASFARPDRGGVVEVPSRDGTETAMVAALPFLSQRHVVRAADLMESDAADHGVAYADRIGRLVAALTEPFRGDTVNLVAAHCMVDGGTLGGGERSAHTVFEYSVPATVFPGTAHYVALGHLHRRQMLPGACPIYYSGSPLQLDFGEGENEPSVIVVDAGAGRPASVTSAAVTGGRRLRTVRGSLAELRGPVGDTVGPDDHIRAVVREPFRVGLADAVRDLFPNCVDVIVERPETDAARRQVTERAGRTPHDLFDQYLNEHGVDDRRLVALFDELFELASAGDQDR
ncbi:MAG: metallophosphoesterase family protein [Acidimicrobiales bacterium]